MEHQITVKKSAISRTKLNLLLDIALLLIFAVTYQAKATGLTLHEWLGVGIGAVIISHILLHWQWVVAITKKFFKKLTAEPRVNYVINAAIFVSFTTAIFSGLMISHSVLPFIGLEAADSGFWKMLHFTSADVTVWLSALHVALHWRWIVDAVKRYVVAPVGQRLGPKPRQSRQTKPHSA
jgi:hypothetical protein